MSQQEVFCPTCRGGNSPQARHCQWCGVSLSAPQPPVYSAGQVSQDQQPAQQKSRSGCLTALSTFLIGSVALLVSVYIQSLFATNNTIPRAKLGTPPPQAQATVPVEQQLASLDAGHIVDAGDSSVPRFRRLLSELADKFSVTPTRIADVTVTARDQLRDKYGRDVTLQFLMEHALEISGSAGPNETYEGIMALMVVTLGNP